MHSCIVLSFALLLFLFVNQEVDAVTCNSGCVNNYTYWLAPSTSWSGSWFGKTTQFCSRTASDWIAQARTAQNNSQPISPFVVANYLTTNLNIQVGGACSALNVRVASSVMRTNYMIPAQDPSNSVCNGGADAFNSLVASQRPLYVTTFYNYVSGTDGGPDLCAPPPI
jgi:hypothetical protein